VSVCVSPVARQPMKGDHMSEKSYWSVQTTDNLVSYVSCTKQTLSSPDIAIWKEMVRNSMARYDNSS